MNNSLDVWILVPTVSDPVLSFHSEHCAQSHHLNLAGMSNTTHTHIPIHTIMSLSLILLIVSQVLTVTFFALVIGAVFWQLDTDPNGFTDRCSSDYKHHLSMLLFSLAQ